MRRVIINCLLLVSLAAAVPGARHKRHLSYLTNLFSSALFGQDQDESSQLGYSVTDPKSKLYRVPGFDDILIKSVTSAPVVVKTVINNPGEVIEPFDTYIGTNNPQGSLAALQNVNNLLSTGILNGQQTNLLKETIVPMTSGINLIQQENIGSVPVISASIKPIQTDVLVNPDGEVDKLVETFNPGYSYKQVEVTNPQVIVKQEFDQPADIPPCIDQSIDEVVEKVMPIGSYTVTNGQYPTAVYQFTPSRLDEPLKIEILERTKNINQKTNPKGHLETPNKSKPKNKNITNVVLTANKEPVDQTGSRNGNKQASHAHNPSTTNTAPVGTNVSNIGNPTEILKNKENGGEKVTEEVPLKGTLAHYIYEHERNKPKPFSKLEHKSKVNNPASIRYVYIPPDYNRLPEAKENPNIANEVEPSPESTPGSPVSVKGNKDGDSVNGMLSKGRGDIPGE